MKNIISMIILMIALFPAKGISLNNTPFTGPEAGTSVSTGIEPLTNTEGSISVSTSSTIKASVGEPIEATVGETIEPNFFIRNWGVLLMSLLGLADVVTRLTPTEKDNSILNFINSVINAIIPNLKKGGGRL